MNKKGVSIILKSIIGLIIAIMVIWTLFTVVDRFIILGKDKQNPSEISFDKLNSEIDNLGINEDITQTFQLEKNYLLIAFNNKDTQIDIKDLEVYSGYKTDINVTIKKPVKCLKNCLCLCKTENKRYLLEIDCLAEEDICKNYKEEIKNNGEVFFLFEEGIKNLNIKKGMNEIEITF